MFILVLLFIAFEYLKHALELGIPYDTQMVLKYYVYYLLLPLSLIQICGKLKDSKTGLLACERYLSYYDNSNSFYADILKWKTVFENNKTN